jgi:orotate phosphoribosyltransferase
MKFPEEFIERGSRVLHSGQTSDVFYNVNAILTDDFYLRHILNKIPRSEHYIGVATGGSLIALVSHVKYPESKFSMIKDGKLLGEKPAEEYILIDDVVTTGNSLLEAISILRSMPEKIIAAVDRRPENKNPEVKAVFEI